MTNHYEQLVQKQAALSTMVAKLAMENRAPSAEEQTQLDAIQKEVQAIRAEFESKGRDAFLRGLDTSAPKSSTLLTKGMMFADAVKGSYAAEEEGLSIGRLLKGYLNGDWTGAELERKAMTSSPTTAGGVLIPTVLSARIIDMARNKAAVFQAGASTVPMSSNNLKVARATGDVSAAWYSANSAIDESSAAFDSVDFAARKMAVLVRVENELLEDAQGIDAAIENSISQAMALELDRVCLLGSGTPPEPKGLYNNSDAQTVTSVGTPADYDKFLTAIYNVRGYNFEPNAVIYSSRTAQTLAKLKTGLSSDKTPLVAPADFQSISKFISNQVPLTGSPATDSAAFVGQFSQLWVGLRRNLLLEVSREASDAFSKDQTFIRATWRGDVQIAQPKAFCVMKGITAT